MVINQHRVIKAAPVMIEINKSPNLATTYIVGEWAEFISEAYSLKLEIVTLQRQIVKGIVCFRPIKLLRRDFANLQL